MSHRVARFDSKSFAWTSGFASGLRPFHQRQRFFADFGERDFPFNRNRGRAANRKEAFTMNQLIKQAVAAAAATATTLVLFSAVASLADGDKSAMLAARIKPTTIAETSIDSVKR